jgi:hypothetical protein
MRAYLSVVTVLMAALFSCSFLSQAQTTQPFLDAIQRRTFRKALDDQLAPESLERMRFPERLAHERQVLEELIAKYRITSWLSRPALIRRSRHTGDCVTT